MDCTIGGFYKITNYIIVHIPKLSGMGFQATIDSLLYSGEKRSVYTHHVMLLRT